MFREDYQLAYKGIKVPEDLKKKVLLEAGEEKHAKRREWLSPVVMAAVMIVCLCVAVPAAAENVPAFYRIIEELSPKLADTLVPIEEECEEKGIILCVEAVNVQGNQAEIILSFRDGKGYDKIHGEVDLFDSYRLTSLGGNGNVGGCSFLKYDEETDKAYFKIDLQADEDFSREKLTVTVGELLCEKSKEEREIELSEYLLTETEYGIRKVTVNGKSWNDESRGKLEEMFRAEKTGEELLDDPRPAYCVMDIACKDKIQQDEQVITGIFYRDGILRIQTCNGDLTKGDRHVQWKFRNEKGEELTILGGVGWKEEIDGKRYDFEETWFEGSVENLNECQLLGTFYESKESVRGNWKVTFRMQQDTGENDSDRIR